ncbi:hypothetical protein IX296_003118 [Bacteroides pyogenes]|nr:hypothetical protein [Bacteroides pyogenes]MBR8740106.1 hypothetical protein [Bacteroides pyogenes]MBR8755868.1 hypothetical protein [Bacteroides pyogenes]MBR8794081.1 hypothetical protein [Bacteroides pyogenes]MBR8797154.1 hypothetical protein [Bacteroides pyogenes]
MVIRRSKHEGVVGGSGGKPNVAGYALVGMNDGMNLDTSFLFVRLGMAPNTFEKEIGEECNRGRVDDAQTLHPVLRLISSAVRAKKCFVLLVKVAIDHLKEPLGASGVGVRQGAASRNRFQTDVPEFTHFCLHRSLYLPQGVETHNDSIKHGEQMRPTVERFYIAFTTLCPTHLNYFITIKRFYQLTIHRLSEEMYTFTHGYTFLFGNSKITKRAGTS